MSAPSPMSPATPAATRPPVCSSFAVGGDACSADRTITHVSPAGRCNQPPCVQRIPWTTDTTGPSFVNCPGDRDLGCNPTAIPECDPTVAATDDCGPATVT